MQKRNRNNECASRLARFFDRLDALGLDGAVLDRPDDLFYFSGYTGTDAVLVLSAKKRAGWLITDSRYTEEAEASAPGFEILLWRVGLGTFAGKRIRSLRLKKVAYTPASLSVAFFDKMKAEAKATSEWRDIDPEIFNLRSVKSAGEVAAMEKALRCAEQAFTASRSRWRVGMTEVEVKNDLEWEMRRLGAQDTAFETIVAVGANASRPHAHAGGGKITPGKMLLIDWGAKLNRYNSDLTRTLWAGEVPKVWLRRYKKVLEAQQAGIAAIRPGIACAKPDLEARRVFAAARLDEFFTHGLGHGVGLAIHEEPRLGRLSTRKLVPGNVVTVEPGVYFPGSGGIRVEDMVLVGENGAEVVSSLARDIDSIVF